MVSKDEFFIVGMGASAGGLETFQHFFSNMVPDSGLAFVLVLHLHPHHKSLMPELLAKSTDMPVLAASEGTEVKPNHVYVITSNTTLTLVDGRLHTEKPGELRGQRMPIDLFFKSLSENCGARAICVVLSGTGSDGTLGLKTVKEHGGLVIAQNPESAKYDSMPRSAIAAGLADMILDVGEMPRKIISFLNKSKILRKELAEDNEVELHLDRIFDELEDKTQHEFEGYKRNTVLRRIRRRMQILQLDSLERYAERVEQDGEEAQNLFKDLLIGVTHFFRDNESFAYLQKRIIPQLLKNKKEGGNTTGLRIWVPGCATGEEAYTLALIVREEAAKIKMSRPVQIFATDIDENALKVARRAVYPEGIEEQLPVEYLARYFTKQGNYYQLHKAIREMCIFSPHNLISDPPYSRIDLITCRNLLIYFDNQLQRKILPVFHYSLNPGGYLFLGPSENISARPKLFRSVSKKHKIFQGCENVPLAMIDFPLGRRSAKSIPQSFSPGSDRKRESEKVLGRAFERKVLEQYVPFSAVINEHGDILYWAGPQAKYLDLPRGIPRNNILEIVHKSLRLTLRSGLHKLLATGREVDLGDVVIQTEEGLERLTIHLSPFREMGEGSGLVFIVIKEMGPPKSTVEGKVTDTQVSGAEVNRQLEEELRDTKDFLQSTIEELETSNEELKSSNEELLSMNEEMQSSNEELQISKEELQSLNEELETVNSELKNKVEELDSANNDLQNLYESTRIATLFLDNELCIKAYTPAATELLRIIDSDIGRPIRDVVHRFSSIDLTAEFRKVLRNRNKRNREVTHRETGNHYFMQMIPYRTCNNVIDGVTVSFVDVTELKKAKTDLEIRERMLRLVTDSVPVLIAYVDNRVRYKYCNAVYGDWFGLNRKDLQGKKVREVLGEESYAEIAPFVDRALAGEIVEYTTTLNLLHGGEKILSIRYEPHLADDGKVCGFISFVQDESERIKKERKLGRLAAIAGSSHEVIIGKNTEGVITDWNTGAEELYGYSGDEAVGQHINLIVPEKMQEKLAQDTARLIEGQILAPFETVRLARDGSEKHILLSLSPIISEGGEVWGISSVGHDISSRIAAEQQLEALNENLERRVVERTEQLHNLTARILNLEQRERRRFSKYLHDEIQQSLVAAKMLVEQAHRAPEGQKVTPMLSEGLRLLNESIQKTRLITVDMSPPLFFDTGISVCLQWLSRWADAKLKQEIETSIEGEEKPIAEEIGYLIFRSLRELLFNIHKHAAVEKAEIAVAYGQDGSLKVVISDAGNGFDTEKIMDAPSEKFGLLSIIEQVRALKGKVKLESEPGKGTRVGITLPDAVIDNSIESKEVSVEKLSGLSVDNRKQLLEKEGKTAILIVDDQEDLRFTLRLMLEEISSDYVYLEADTARAAIEAVKEFKPQLVLMDISMPGMSGVEATRKIKEESGKTAVIGLSMHDREDMEKAMIEAGAEGYLTKSSSSEVILAAIEECLEKQRQQADQRR